MITLESILEKDNLNKAFRQVVSNKGTAGIDDMTVDELEPWIRAHPHELTNRIQSGKYRQHPVMRVYIPKDNGEKRPLGIPRVIDRLVQQAVAQELSREFEPIFSDNSYGFRPNRSAHDAIRKVIANANDGYEYVIDLDLAKFFDTVNHSKLLQVLSETIKDGRVISLIHKFLRAKIMDEGKVTTPTIGTPQGGPVSPVLANILLNELDKELDKRGHHFVRYADDMMIMCKSQRAAQRTYESISKFIEKKLFLNINKDKTKICHLSEDVKFLGYTFMKRQLKNDETTKWHASVHRKSLAKLKVKIKALTDRRCPKGWSTTKTELNTVLRGWFNYFRLGIRKTLVTTIDGWTRRRIRQMYWKTWKKNSTRIKELEKLGINKDKAYQWGNSSKSYWRIAGSFILCKALTNKAIKEKGWSLLSDLFYDGIYSC
ncbi:group II intron reverse transcriptase/maturase [Bullifex porci]|uniref:group II intron reverse transcriptase/maturase n=1 Tax=Bullifex porci TaxID=2606638 RepID=UPI0023EFF83D|nr:group II intron reverse transcriptase/maturase [Bullifex porci]MDD7588859.1 group II intron reverse transcriptase/maturase [Bullifex porci]